MRLVDADVVLVAEHRHDDLEEAVAAYRDALREYTCERVPLDWAMTQNNLGNALATLGERTQIERNWKRREKRSTPRSKLSYRPGRSITGAISRIVCRQSTANSRRSEHSRPRHVFHNAAYRCRPAVALEPVSRHRWRRAPPVTPPAGRCPACSFLLELYSGVSSHCCTSMAAGRFLNIRGSSMRCFTLLAGLLVTRWRNCWSRRAWPTAAEPQSTT